MAGKRLKKRNRMRLPARLMTLLAAALLLSLEGPQTAAVSSPEERPPLAAEPAEVPVEIPNVLFFDRSEENTPVADLPYTEKAWSGPIPEGEPVEDTYFEKTAFLGDSRTDGFRLHGDLEEGTYFCATGATVESVFTKPVQTAWGELPLLDALRQDEYERIYIMLGVNELGWKGTDIFREQSGKLLIRLREDHPETEIVIQSILPVSQSEEARKTYVNNRRIAEYNQVWRELAEELEFAYLDVAETVTGEDGCLPRELTYDGVHLNKKGCAVWLDYLRTHPVPSGR